MVRSGQLGAARCCGCRGPPACLGGSPACVEHLGRVSGGLEGENRILEAATEPPVAGFGAWRGVRRSGPHSEVRDILISILGHSGPSLYGFGASRVSIDRLAEAPLLCAPAAVSPPQCEERSDQIGGTGVTCGPRRPKRLVMGSQGHGDNPAAASRRRTPSYKYTSTSFGGEISFLAWLSGNYSLPSSAQASCDSDRQTSLIWSRVRAYPHKNGLEG